MNEAELKIMAKELLNDCNKYNEELIKVLENIKRSMDNVQNIVDKFDNNKLAIKVLNDISTEMEGTEEKQKIQDNVDKISELLKELNLF